MKYEKKDLKWLSFDLNIKQVGEEDPDFFRFEGFGSTFGNIDRGEEVVKKGAFLESLKEMMPSLFWQHDSSEPLGIFEEAFENDVGLFLRGKMPKSDTFVSGRVIPQMKIGAITKMSIGFSIQESERENRDGKSILILTKLKLWEVSLVSIPMNPLAAVTGFKEVVPFQDLPIALNEDGEPDTDRVWDSSAAKQRVRVFTDSEESPSADYKKCFLWYDKEEGDTFGAYKLPISDVIDNKLTAVPRAIFAAAAAMRGARGGVDIPDSDRPGVIANINRYYKKMGLESPFQRSLSATIDELSNVKEISGFLKSQGFSNRESESLINASKRLFSGSVLRGKHDGQPENGSLSGNHSSELLKMHESLNALNSKIKEKFHVS